MRTSILTVLAACLTASAFAAETKANAVDAALAQAKKDKKLVAIVVYQFG
jgi:hypothetical protein